MKKLLLSCLTLLLIIVATGCASNIDLSKENIDSVRPGLKYDLYALRAIVSTETSIDKNESGQVIRYSYISLNITIEMDKDNVVKSISGRADGPSKFRTSKGIGKGSTVSEIEKAYGTRNKNKQKYTNGDTDIMYQDKINNIELKFMLDNSGVVSELSLSKK